MRTREQIKEILERAFPQSQKTPDEIVSLITLELLLDVRDLLISQNEQIDKTDRERAFIAQSSVLLAERMGLPSQLIEQGYPVSKPHSNELTQQEIAEPTKEE